MRKIKLIIGTILLNFNVLFVYALGAIPEMEMVSANTSEPDKTKIIEARTTVTLTDGFCYTATPGESLLVRISPAAAYSIDIKDCPISADSDAGRFYGTNDAEEMAACEVLPLQPHRILIRNNHVDSSVDKSTGYFEIIQMEVGKIIRQGSLTGYETTIDIPGIESGLYVVKITSGNLVYTRKIRVKGNL